MTLYDVVTFGETMLRLTPPNMLRIEQTRSLDVYLAGAESNTGIALARLGIKVNWFSRMTRNPMAYWIQTRIAQHGVTTSDIIWTDEDRVGLIFVEQGVKPRGNQAFYDRKNSAISRIQPDDLPEELFQPNNAKLLHLSGLTVALSQTASDTVNHACKLAKDAGWLISFDMNYRTKLWSPEEMRVGCQTVIEQVDVLFITRNDAQVFLGVEDNDAESLIDQLLNRFPKALIVMTLGADGSMAKSADSPVYRQASMETQELDRVGRGDAFVAGFLCQYLENPNADNRIQNALHWGNACAVWKNTVRGDIAVFQRHEIEALVTGNQANWR